MQFIADIADGILLPWGFASPCSHVSVSFQHVFIRTLVIKPCMYWPVRWQFWAEIPALSAGTLWNSKCRRKGQMESSCWDTWSSEIPLPAFSRYFGVQPFLVVGMLIKLGVLCSGLVTKAWAQHPVFSTAEKNKTGNPWSQPFPCTMEMCVFHGVGHLKDYEMERLLL